MNPVVATHIDGPALIPWLAHRLGMPVGELSSFVGRRWETRIHRWRKGTAAKVETVDELLCELNVCLGEIPDDFYRDRPKIDFSPIPPETVTRIVELGSAGEHTLTEIAREVGASRATVRDRLAKAGVGV